jgi:hypothetical protein
MRGLTVLLLALALLVQVPTARAQGCGGCPMQGGQPDRTTPPDMSAPPARPGMGMGHDDGHRADMQVLHFLLAHRAEIRRSVTNLPDGIDTVTESDVPEVAATIKGHVASMYKRVEDKRPIHQRDPLFREIFANADKIVMKTVPTEKGIRVIETSTDPYVASLLHEHAKVLNLFIANGMAEMHKDHPVPPRK